MPLNVQQLSDLDRDGFLILKDLFSAEEVAAIRARLPALFAADDPANIREKESGEVRTAMGLHLRDPSYRIRYVWKRSWTQRTTAHWLVSRALIPPVHPRRRIEGV